MKLEWQHHDAGYIYARGRNGRYEIGEAFGAHRYMFRLDVHGHTAYFSGLDVAKQFAQAMEE